jgi:hypothetical protein
MFWIMTCSTKKMEATWVKEVELLGVDMYRELRVVSVGGSLQGRKNYLVLYCGLAPAQRGVYFTIQFTLLPCFPFPS